MYSLKLFYSTVDNDLMLSVFRKNNQITDFVDGAVVVKFFIITTKTV